MFLEEIIRGVRGSLDSAAVLASSAAAIDAHAALARTLAAGESIAADPTGALRALGLGASPPSSPPSAGAAALGYVRLLPASGAFDVHNVPAWAHGMTVARSTGALIDEHGIPSFIDTIVPATTPTLAIVRVPAGTVIAYVQSASANETSAGGTTTVTFGAGSLWLVANGLVASAPANAYAGIAFSGATLTVPGGLASTPIPQYNLPAATVATFSLTPAAAAAPVAGLTNDGTACVATLPASVVFSFAPGGVSVTQVATATLAAYGESVALNATSGPAAVTYDSAALALNVPFASAGAAQFTIAANVSPTLRVAGTASIAGAAYRIAVALTTPANLGSAASGGSLALTLGSGLRVRWGNLTADVSVAGAIVQVETGSLQVGMTTDVRPFADTYELWDATASDGGTRPTSITLNGPRGTEIIATQSSGLDAVTAINCAVAVNLDRPRTVNGTTARFDLLVVNALVGVTPTGGVLIVLGASPPSLVGRSESFALENALLRTSGITGLLVSATLDAGRAVKGALLTGSVLQRLVPTLPDPYAATVSGAGIALQNQTLLGAVGWTSPGAVSFGFALPHPATTTAAAATAAAAAAPGVSPPTAATAASVSTSAAGVSAPVSATTADALRSLLQAPAGGAALVATGRVFPFLFDVSGAANQFGVAYTAQAVASASIIGHAFAVGSDQSALVTVPDVAWEPVIDTDRNYFPVFATDDGGPAVVAVTAGTAVTLRPAEPRAFLTSFLADYAGGANLLAQVTLPFGLTASIDTSPSTEITPVLRPVLADNAPAFPASALTGGAQLSIVGQTDATHTQALLPGTSRAQDAYAQQMLGADIASFWNQDFAGGPVTGGPGSHFVPVERVDLSGYGLSLFSNYVDASPDPGIAHARFDVIAGRTSYEIVQAQSVIMPYRIEVVNTTIFSRDDDGYVNRTNSGWQAKGPGVFDFIDAGIPAVELGGITGVYNVRNIREIAGPTTSVLGKNWVAVTFDADIGLQTDPTALRVNGAATILVNGVPTPALPSHNLTGWLDLTANPTHNPALRPGFADALALLQTFGPATGPAAGDADVAGTGIGVTLTGIEIKATRNDAPAPTIGIAFATTPHLPRDGAWSIGKRASTDSVPQPVDTRTPVPLVRPLGTTTWHFADAADLHILGAPAQLYGFVQGTGTQKVFFEHPTVAPPGGGTNPLNFVQSPKLADVGSLLGSSGLLPDIASLLDFGAFGGFKPAGDGFGGQTLQNNVAITDKTLISLGPIRVSMSTYPDGTTPGNTSQITLTIDAAAPAGTPRWHVSITNVAFKLFVDGGDALVTIHGNVSAQDGSAPSLSPLTVDYGSLLDSVREILDGIETFVQFLPDAGKSGIDVSFAGSALRVREAFPIPQLPLGLGFLENIALDLGFDVDLLARTIHFFVGVGTEQDPFHWLVSPLSGNGLLQLGATDTLGVEMQAGIGVGLGIDLAIASGSASIVLAVRIDTTKTPFGAMVLLTGNAAVDVLDGLASVSLTLTAGVGVQVSPPWTDPIRTAEDPIGFLKGTVVTLSAEVAVGIHITVGWFFHIDFDDSWPFSESISGATLTSLLP